MEDLAYEIMGEIATYVDSIRKVHDIVEPEEVYLSNSKTLYEINTHKLEISIDPKLDVFDYSEFANFIAGGSVYFEFIENIKLIISNILSRYSYTLKDVIGHMDMFGVKLDIIFNKI